MFKVFQNAKSAFSTFLFLNRFQLWLYILGGYHWGNLSDVGWRLSEMVFFHVGHICHVHHVISLFPLNGKVAL